MIRMSENANIFCLQNMIPVRAWPHLLVVLFIWQCFSFPYRGRGAQGSSCGCAPAADLITSD